MVLRQKQSFVLRTSLPILAAALFLPGCGGSEDDPSPSTGDSMGGAEQVDGGGTACEADSDCNDFVYCNGEEECHEGFCRQGDPIDCDDGIDCTIDLCNEVAQTCESTPPDEDGDGHPDRNCEDEDGAALGDDCDDSDPLAFPGNNEVCDPENRDEDCNPNTFGSQDSDQDGFIDALCCNEQANGDLNCGDDCDDRKPNVNPTATEACDFLDNNCDGETDEGVSITMYEDKDHDGRGDDDVDTVQSCAGAVGFALIDGDCDDEDPEVFEGQFEICDEKDNNCDGQVDEVQEQAPWYKDVDGDGYGDPESTPVFSCFRIPGRVLSQNDCADDNNKVNPNATELCDGLDNDCNGAADFKLSGANNFEDDDGDGAPDAECQGGTDCNDNDPRTAEGAEEVCDRIDNDCDGEVDEQTVQNIWYIDEDGDGWGVVIGSALASCDPIPGRASQFGDCDDNDRDRKPGVVELCDGIDQDCDGLVDEGAGVHCDLPNALNTCRFGQCDIFSCVPGFRDADNNPANGCEEPVNPADLLTGTPCTFDTECNDGDLCNGIETCFTGQCRLGTPINCSAGPSVIQGDVDINNGLDLRDLEGIDMITGDLTIDSTTLSSLVGLESLKVIGGNLFIRNNGNLIRLSGSALSELEVVGGDIMIEANSNLISASLPSLISARSLNVVNNGSLQTLDNFPNLADLEQILYVFNNAALETIDGFESLVRIGGAHDPASGGCDDVGGLEIDNNLGLQTISAFESLQRVEGDICVDYAAISNLEFPALQEIGQDFDMVNTMGLEDLIVPNLEVVGGSIRGSSYGGEGAGGLPLRALSMPALQHTLGEINVEFDGFNLTEIDLSNLQDANGLTLRATNPADQLAALNLDSLTMATWIEVNFGGNGTISSVDFPVLQDVAGHLTLNVRSPISQVTAPALQQIGGNLQFFVQSDAINFIDFPDLQTVSGFVNVQYSGTGTLMGIDFQSLVTVHSDFTIAASTNALNIASLDVVGVPLNDRNVTLTIMPADVCADIARMQTPPNEFVGILSGDQTCGVL